MICKRARVARDPTGRAGVMRRALLFALTLLGGLALALGAMVLERWVLANGWLGRADPRRGSRSSYWVQKLASSDPREVSEACSVLRRLGRPAAPLLNEALAHGNWEVRERAAGILTYPPPHRATLGATAPGLIRALGDPHPRVRWQAATALSELGLGSPYLEKARTALAAGLTDEDEGVRARFAVALGNLTLGGWPCEEALRALTLLLDDPNRIVRESAVQGLGNALGNLTPASHGLQAALNRLMEKGVLSPADEAHRSMLERDLARELANPRRLTPAQRAAVSGLERRLIDPAADVRLAAAEALAIVHAPVDPGKLIPVLVEGLADGGRWRAAQGLRLLGPKAKVAGPALARALANTQARNPVKLHVAMALAAVDGKTYATQLLPILMQALGKEEFPSVAAVALGQLGRAAKPALPAIKAIVADTGRDVDLRQSAVQAIERILGPGTEALEAELPKNLRDDILQQLP